MPLLILLLLLIAGPVAWREPALADRNDCPIEEALPKLEEAEAVLMRAEARLAAYPPKSPMRSRMADWVGNERAVLDAFYVELGAMDRVGRSSLDQARRRIAELAELAEAPPIRYSHATHHDPTSVDFRGGGSMTTTLPRDAETVFVNAIPEAGSRGVTWWGYNGTDYYRYQGSVVGDVTDIHWNGTTAGGSGSRAIRLEDIPIEVRRRFGRIR